MIKSQVSKVTRVFTQVHERSCEIHRRSPLMSDGQIANGQVGSLENHE